MPTEDVGADVQETFDTGVVEPGPLPTDASGRALGLDDIFSIGGEWDENRYDVADRNALRGMGVPLRQCGDDWAAELELRLAHKFSNLSMNVGQANTSASSDDTLVVEVLANGSQTELQKVPFDTIQPINVPVDGVNALKLRFSLDVETCSHGDGVVAVVENLTVS